MINGQVGQPKRPLSLSRPMQMCNELCCFAGWEIQHRSHSDCHRVWFGSAGRRECFSWAQLAVRPPPSKDDRLLSLFQGAFACDMILLYMMNTSSYYREKKFEIINFKYDPTLGVAAGLCPNVDHATWPSVNVAAGKRSPNPRRGRWVTRKEDPGNKLMTTPKNQRAAKTQLTLLPRRTTSPWTPGVPPSPVTQDSVTLPSSLRGLQSRGTTSLSPHTTRLERGARPPGSHRRFWRLDSCTSHRATWASATRKVCWCRGNWMCTRVNIVMQKCFCCYLKHRGPAYWYEWIRTHGIKTQREGHKCCFNCIFCVSYTVPTSFPQNISKIKSVLNVQGLRSLPSKADLD